MPGPASGPLQRLLPQGVAMIDMPVVIMGVSGAGKTTVGTLLASRLDMPFIDGDALHSSANKNKMAAGEPLTDADRLPWLEALAAVLARAPAVVACSALKRGYRDILREAAPRVRFIYLAGSRATLMSRVTGRSHEFMPAKMLDSQIHTLEPPEPDEGALTLSIEADPARIVDSVLRWLRKPGSQL